MLYILTFYIYKLAFGKNIACLKESFTKLGFFPNAKVQQKVYSDNYSGEKRNMWPKSLGDAV